MTIQELGSIGELLGALATIATLIYLALQIRQHNSHSRLQAFDNFSDKVTRWFSRMNESPELLQIYLEGQKEFGGFDELGKWRFNLIMMELLVIFEAGFEHIKHGYAKPELESSMHRKQ